MESSYENQRIPLLVPFTFTVFDRYADGNEESLTSPNCAPLTYFVLSDRKLGMICLTCGGPES